MLVSSMNFTIPHCSWLIFPNFFPMIDIMIVGSIFYIIHSFVYGFALSKYKPDKGSKKEDNGGSEIVFPVAPLTRPNAEPNPNAV